MSDKRESRTLKQAGAPHGVQSVRLASYQILSPKWFARKPEEEFRLQIFKKYVLRIYIGAGMFIFKGVE